MIDLPGWGSVLPIALASTLVWTAIGYPFARRCLPAPLPAAACAPMLGWALHVTVSATVLGLAGFGRLTIIGIAAALLAAAWGLHRNGAPLPTAPRLPKMVFVLVALIALAPAASVLPHHLGEGVGLAAPIFDHSKIALVDAIARQGLPPANPFFGGPAAQPLAYYYWWHLEAAELERVFSTGGWSADAAETWFTAFATMLLIAGVAMAVGGARLAIGAMALSLAGSLWPLLGWAVGAGWLSGGGGLGCWLNQASWAPQHLASAGCLVMSALLLARLAEGGTAIVTLLLAVTVAAGFGCSTWVGGVACALALPIAAGFLLGRLPRAERLAFLAQSALAAPGAVVLVLPLLSAQWGSAASRGGALPVAVALPGLAPLMLISFPALVLPGLLGLGRAKRHNSLPWQSALAGLAAGSLAVSCLLASTIDNNDLGWRAILPALLIAPGFAAGAIRDAGPALRIALLGLAALGLPGTLRQMHENFAAVSPFRPSMPAWDALHRLSAPGDRVASNPVQDASATLWPANIGWALLADRPSCYSGWATAHPFVPLPTMQLYAVDQIFRRVFAGSPTPQDMAALAGSLQCRFALLTAADPGWLHDPFAASAAWMLAARGDGFRLYRLRQPVL